MNRLLQELDLNSDDAQKMTTQLREGIVERKPKVTLSGDVECDEVYVVAGHKGKPEEVKKKGGPGAAVGLKGERGRGTLEKEKPPIFGMMQRQRRGCHHDTPERGTEHDRPADQTNDC